MAQTENCSHLGFSLSLCRCAPVLAATVTRPPASLSPPCLSSSPPCYWSWATYRTASASVFNKPGIAGAVLQTPPSLGYSLSHRSFFSKPSKHHYTQTLWARELKFWENVHPRPRVTCQLSGVTCHVSSVRCQVSGYRCYVSGVISQVSVFLSFFGQSGGASPWRVCYQRGLPHLV